MENEQALSFYPQQATASCRKLATFSVDAISIVACLHIGFAFQHQMAANLWAGFMLSRRGRLKVNIFEYLNVSLKCFKLNIRLRQ